MAIDTQTASNVQLDVDDLRGKVRQMYRAVAQQPGDGPFHFEMGRALAERLGYPKADLDRIPHAALESFAGVGYYFDFAALRPGETVVDLGSGSGTDAFTAALHVRDTGHVIGIDMTDAQLEKATRLRGASSFDPFDKLRVDGEQSRTIDDAQDVPSESRGTARQSNPASSGLFAHVEFREGLIEQIPVRDGQADCVVSNGVINLCPDKKAVFAEAARVLRPGGRLALADIVTQVQLPSDITCNATLWAACIGGASQQDDYLGAIELAGLRVITVRDNPEYRFLSRSAQNATRQYGVRSISLVAVKEAR